MARSSRCVQHAPVTRAMEIHPFGRRGILDSSLLLLPLLAGCAPPASVAPTTELAAEAPPAIAPPAIVPPAIAQPAAATSAIAPQATASPAAATAVPVRAGGAPAAPPVVVPPLPAPVQERDCDRDRADPELCVPPRETEGSPRLAGGCGKAPRRDVCPSCRPVFRGFEGGRCCYVGRSRLPRCMD